MQEQLAKKFAHLLAECAETGNTAAFQKEAAAYELVKESVSPLSLGLASLGGAAVGGLGGYYGTDSKKEKQRRRNAIYGALTGALAGPAARVAIPHILDLVSGKTDPAPPVMGPPPAQNSSAKGLTAIPAAAYDAATSSTPLGLTGVGAVGGAISGARSPGTLSGAAANKNELSRLATAPGGKNSPKLLPPAAQQALGALRHNPAGVGPSTAAILKNDTLGLPLNPTKPTLKTRIFGQPLDDDFRRSQAALLAARLNKDLPAGKGISGPTLLSALEKLPKHQRSRGMGALRGGARGGAAGFLSGLGLEALMRILTNSATDPKNAPIK